MRFGSALFGLLLALVLAAPAAHAVEVPFTGTLTLQFGDQAPVQLPGSGTATVNKKAPFVGPLWALTVPAGAFATVPDAAFATPVGAFATVVNAQNMQVQVRRGMPCTKNHPNVTCPGHGLAGFGGLSGTALVGANGDLFSVPLSVIGGGSVTADYGITLSGAGWTTGQVGIYSPDEGTTYVVTGTREKKGDELTLVSPVQLTVDGVGSVPSFARMRIRFTTPPMAPPIRRSATFVLVAAMVAGLGMAWARKRR